MSTRCLLAVLLVTGLIMQATATAAAQPRDSVKQVLELVRQADGLIVRIREAVRAKDIPTLRDLIARYVETMKTAADAAKKLAPDGTGVEHALKTVREATLRHQTALEQALAMVESPEAKAALERALAAAETGHNVATDVLEKIEAGSPGPPTGVPAGKP